MIEPYVASLNDVHEAALVAANCGISVLPIRLDGSKAPALRWKSLQTTPLSVEQIDRQFARPSGLALICGQVSGGLELLEFEAGYLGHRGAASLVTLARCAGYDTLINRVFRGYTEISASGGLHILYRCPDPRTEKLGFDHAGKTVCETKGEGGYVIVAPTPAAAHPTSEHGWMVESGTFATIPTISSEERAVLHAFARLAVADKEGCVTWAA